MDNYIILHPILYTTPGVVSVVVVVEVGHMGYGTGKGRMAWLQDIEESGISSQ